jgi:pimeloyl-ACP methyl ester carboxylesterase
MSAMFSKCTKTAPEAAETLFLAQPTQSLDLTMEIKRLALPTLLVHGELDPLVDVRDLEYLRPQLPESKLVVI